MKNKRRRKCLTLAQWKYLQSIPKICSICEEKNLIPNPENNPMTIDHIIPVSKNGTNDTWNLRWMCRFHNYGRGQGGRKCFDSFYPHRFLRAA
jgi:5-methylcytosine-specific restriction endonuclease McrA